MSLINVIKEECIQRSTGAATKDELLRRIAVLAKKNTLLSEVAEDDIFNALKAREDISSTGFEHGIAIPHCFFPGLDDFVIGIIIEPDGLDFNAFDQQKSSIFVFIIGPKEEKARHIRFLSSISHTLRIPEARHELLAEETPVAIRESFLRHSTVEEPSAEDEETVTMQVIIQNEDHFEPILEIFCGMGVLGLSVLEGENADDYLNKMPLFSSVISGKGKSFNRLLYAIMKKSLANEMIRQIDLTTGGLNKIQGVMVVVQENVLTAGSIFV